MPVEVAHASPDPIAASIDDARDKDARHRSQLFLRGAPPVPPGEPPLAGGAPSASRFGGGILANSLHIPRLADKSRHFRKGAALDANIRQQGIDQRRLDAITKRGIDHFVGRAAPAIAAVAAIPAMETVDLQDADGLDLLHRANALAHDALDPFEEPTPE